MSFNQIHFVWYIFVSKIINRKGILSPFWKHGDFSPFFYFTIFLERNAPKIEQNRLKKMKTNVNYFKDKFKWNKLIIIIINNLHKLFKIAPVLLLTEFQVGSRNLALCVCTFLGLLMPQPSSFFHSVALDVLVELV